MATKEKEKLERDYIQKKREGQKLMEALFPNPQ